MVSTIPDKVKIKSITKKPYHGIVYNFGVAEDESYTVEGVKVANCRGVWIPILQIDPDQPKVTGIPQSLTKRFNTVDGKPTINDFKQVKKPINLKKNKAAEQQIKKRLEDGGN